MPGASRFAFPQSLYGVHSMRSIHVATPRVSATHVSAPLGSAATDSDAV